MVGTLGRRIDVHDFEAYQTLVHSVQVIRSVLLWMVLLPAVRSPLGQITEFPIPTANSSPTGIAAGPDGNLWFTELTGNKIGRITTSGTITEFPIATVNSLPDFITAGPDGNLWFTEANGNKIGRITTAGAMTEFPIPIGVGGPMAITLGPDLNLWFTAAGKVGKITPDGVVTVFSTMIQPSSGSTGITSGQDGNIWFADGGVFIGSGFIGSATPSGVVRLLLAIDSSPQQMTTGPDDNIWFTDFKGGLHGIARISPDGVITRFPSPTFSNFTYGITAGPDDNLWFTEWASRDSGDKIGRSTVTGRITEFSVPSGVSLPLTITTGPDGNIWFTEVFGNRIGRLTLPIPLVRPRCPPHPSGPPWSGSRRLP